MVGVISTLNHPKLLWSGVKGIWGSVYIVSPLNIPLTIRARIIERKLADLENELADIASHMSALPGPAWERRTRQLRKAGKLLAGWRKKL